MNVFDIISIHKGFNYGGTIHDFCATAKKTLSKKDCFYEFTVEGVLFEGNTCGNLIATIDDKNIEGWLATYIVDYPQKDIIECQLFVA